MAMLSNDNADNPAMLSQYRNFANRNFATRNFATLKAATNAIRQRGRSL